MELRRSVIDNYTRALRGLEANAREMLERALYSIDFADPNAYALVLEAFRQIAPAHVEWAASAAAEFYDMLRYEELGARMGAVGVSAYDEKKAAVAAGAAVKKGREDGVGAAVSLLAQRVAYDIVKSAGDTVFDNGKRDRRRVLYARVPSGSETCLFCLMLASRGFVYSNAGTAGENSHYHANCDCRIVPSFGKRTGVEGYDPDALYGKWSEAVDREAAARAEENGTDEADEKRKLLEAMQPKKRR